MNRLRSAFAFFWEELRRRRVLQTAVAYLVGGWLLIEVTTTIFPALLLPDWSVRIVVAIVILTFPFVLVLAWMFDIQRTDRRPSPGATAAPVDSGAQGRSLPPVPDSAVGSVAVLPFRDLSPGGDQQLLAQGIATELHAMLAKMHRLRVVSRSSSFSLGSVDADVRETAGKLNARFVLSGSVRCGAGRMRVIAELDDGIEGMHVWSGSYDRDLEDVFAVQSEIARAIAASFGGALLKTDIESATRQPTDVLDAWQLVQSARAYVLAFSPRALEKAIGSLRRAIELDPDYAIAHAALAFVHAEQVLNGLGEPVQALRDTALASAELALSCDATDPFVLKMCGATWAYFGNVERSLEALRRAVSISPFDFGAWGYLGWPLVSTAAAADLDEVHTTMSRLRDLAPDHPGVPYWLYHQSVACTCAGRADDAVDFAFRSVERNPMFPWGWLQYANALGSVGRIADGRRALARGAALATGLTPAHYEWMVCEMHGSRAAAEPRFSGIRRLAECAAE